VIRGLSALNLQPLPRPAVALAQPLFRVTKRQILRSTSVNGQK